MSLVDDVSGTCPKYRCPETARRCMDNLHFLMLSSQLGRLFPIFVPVDCITPLHKRQFPLNASVQVQCRSHCGRRNCCLLVGCQDGRNHVRVGLAAHAHVDQCCRIREVEGDHCIGYTDSPDLTIAGRDIPMPDAVHRRLETQCSLQAARPRCGAASCAESSAYTSGKKWADIFS